jgi:hypothetical protein
VDQRFAAAAGMIRAMRRRMLFVLALVLLLRTWAGEAMAGQMLAHQLQAATSVAAVVHGPDCPGAALMEAATDKSESTCGSCLQCQDCSMNVLPSLPASTAQAIAPQPETPVRLAFSSAEPLPGFKPPIA